MKIDVFTEGSNTTSGKDESTKAIDYFEGGFLPIKDLANGLRDYGDVNIHIISDEYGYVTGSDSIKSTESSERPIQVFTESLIDSSMDSDVVVVLLTQKTFNEVVKQNWDQLVSNLKQNQIWCFGVSRSALSSVDIGELRTSRDDIIIYQRVGVARISSECKQKLVEAVADKH
jgi:hypothetical protein